MTGFDISDAGDWITNMITDYIDHSPENHLQDADRERAFDTPLVGFAAGDDPLFGDYKSHVGPFHWTPLEIFMLTFPQSDAVASDLTVISWILPQTRVTKADNRKESQYPAERWSRARTYGEQVNVKLRRHMESCLKAEGVDVVAAMLSPHWQRETSDKFGFASRWSERHAAYASGLGTFGLSDGLITALGKAIRVGSVVARINIPPTPRPYTDHHAYCLFYSKGICGKCIDRCPTESISEAGHEKVKCKAYIRQVAMPYIKTSYGFEGKGCGLCQTGVPCESKIPIAKDAE